MVRTKRSSRAATEQAPWWATHFDAAYLHEYEPLFTETRDRAEVARLLDVLESLPVGARVLDCPCGQGRHSRLLAEAGFAVDALDYSKELLRVAERATPRTLRAQLHYTRGDMRKLPHRWRGRFDAVLNLFTSFGFFDDPADDRRVLHEFVRVLKKGGVLVWHGGSRDGVMGRFLSRDWWTAADGTVFGQERAFDPLSGFLSVRSTWHGPAVHGERSHRIRLYSATHLAELMTEAGLVVEAAYSGWSERPLTRRAGEMLLVARKPLS